MKRLREIGGHLTKGLAEEITSKLHAGEAVHIISIEAGRAEDLLDFKEFGTAGEVDILSLLVDADAAQDIFEQLCHLAGLGEARNGELFLSNEILKASLS
ncbi:MAG: hypothetical protein ACON4J_07000 [Parvibaculales bacterium]